MDESGFFQARAAHVMVFVPPQSPMKASASGKIQKLATTGHFQIPVLGFSKEKKQIDTSIGYRVSIWANLSWRLCLPSLWGSKASMSKSRTALGSRPAAESPQVPWQCQAPCGPWAHQVESRFRTWLCRFCYLDFPFSPNLSHSLCDTQLRSPFFCQVSPVSPAGLQAPPGAAPQTYLYHYTNYTELKMTH